MKKPVIKQDPLYQLLRNEDIKSFNEQRDTLDSSELKSGDYREKFSIEIDNPHGAAQYNGNSGGEKQKINVLSIEDMSSQRRPI